MTWLFVGFVVLGAVGAFWLLLAAARTGEPETDRTTGTLVFRHGRLFRGVALIVLLGLPALIVGLAIAAPPQTPFGFAFFIFLALGCLVLGFVLSWEAFRYRLRVNPNGWEYRSPWRGRVRIAWSDISEVTFSRANLWFVFHSREKRPVRMSVLLPGLRRALEMCEARLQPAVLFGAVTGYGWVKRPIPTVLLRSHSR